MEARKCDICGTLYEKPIYVPKYTIVEPGILSKQYDHILDLCPECLKKIRHIVEHGWDNDKK